MTEKSGIELLEELVRKIDLLTKKVDVLDHNVKRIANSTKLTEIINKAAGTSLDGWARANNVKAQVPDVKQKIAEVKEKAMEKTKGMRFNFERRDASKTKQPVAKRTVRPSVPQRAMVKGKMVANVDGKTVPLSNISVKIFDSSDKLIKETRTNRAGHWMGQLPPGSYVALFEGEYNGNPLVPENKMFEVPAGVKEIEVT
jgi:hypothetical protein